MLLVLDVPVFDELAVPVILTLGIPVTDEEPLKFAVPV